MSCLHISAATALTIVMLASAPAYAEEQPVGPPIQLLATSASEPSGDARPSLLQRAARVFRTRSAGNVSRPVVAVPFAPATGTAMPLDFDAFVGPDESPAAAAVPPVEGRKAEPKLQASVVPPRLPRARPVSITGAGVNVAAAEPDAEAMADPGLVPSPPAAGASVEDEAGQTGLSDIPSGHPDEDTGAIVAVEETRPHAQDSEASAEPEEARAEASDIGSAQVDIGVATGSSDATPAEKPEAEAAQSDEADSASPRAAASQAAIAEEALEPMALSGSESKAGPAEDRADHRAEDRHEEMLTVGSEPEGAVDAVAAAGQHVVTDHGDAAVAEPAEETLVQVDEPADLEPSDEGESEAHSAEEHAAATVHADAPTAGADEEMTRDSGAPHEETARAAPAAAEEDETEAGELAPASTEIAYPDGTPRDLVLSLQVLQDQIAAGSTEAFAAQREVLDRIERAFSKMPPEAWSEPGNAAALVTYTLSGGKPTTLREVLTRGPMPPLDDKLLHGALAYVEGRAGAAKNALAGVDARSFPPSMGSQVAIAQAALQIDDDPVEAGRLLDLARLLSPGTLAEEAAIRRALPVAAQLQDAEKFQLLARQYVERFHRSVYAGNFRQRFAASLTRMQFIETPEGFGKLDDILGVLEPEARREILLLISRAALVKAKTGAAILAADAIIADPSANAQAQERAKTYRAAAELVLPDRFDEASNALVAIDAELLDAADRELLDLASKTAALVRSAADRPAGSLPALAEGEEDPKSAVAIRAETAIASVDTLLESTR